MNDDDKGSLFRLLEDSEDWGVWHKCPVKDCVRTFPNFAGLMAHLRRDHPGSLNINGEKKDGQEGTAEQ